MCLLDSACQSQTVPKENPGPTAADYEGWSLFADSRIGFKLPVPPGISAGKASATAAPYRFTSGDGSFVMTAWGGFSSSPLRIMEWQWSQARGAAGRTLVMQQKDSAGFVISGADRNGTKFFQKFVIRGDRLATFTLVFPESRLREFGALTSKIETAFNISASLPDPSRTTSAAARAPEANTSPNPSENIDLTPPPPSSAKKEFEQYLLKGQRIAVDRVLEKARAVRKSSSPASGSQEPSPQKSQETPVWTETAVENIPLAVPVTGQPGIVYSPYQENMPVDAVDLPSGTKVKCPYTGKLFRIP